MTDLHVRFRRLDRVRTPDLWYEAVGRATTVDTVRPAFNPTLALIALGLLLAALGGVITVGSWLNRPAPIPKIVTYSNGLLVQSPDCGELVGIDPVTLAARQLVAKQASCEEGGLPPAWSLNGERLAYVVPSHEEATAAIWIYEASTGQSHRVADCRSWCSDVTISPDGGLIAYLDWLDGGPSLLVAGVDSGEPVQEVALIGSPRTPVFSPDGTRIALPLFGGRSGLYLVDVSRARDGEIGTPYLLHGIVDASDAAWSPDGEWIAITQIGGLGELGRNDLSPFNGQIPLAGQGIVVVRADGSEARILATGAIERGPALPTWSADSSTVAYVESASEGEDQWAVTLSTVGLDGSAPTRIWTSGCCVDGSSRPVWSPDGEWIALAVAGTEGVIHSDVFLISPDGAEVRSAPGHPWEPVWQPIPNE